MQLWLLLSAATKFTRDFITLWKQYWGIHSSLDLVHIDGGLGSFLLLVCIGLVLHGGWGNMGENGGKRPDHDYKSCDSQHQLIRGYSITRMLPPISHTLNTVPMLTSISHTLNTVPMLPPMSHTLNTAPMLPSLSHTLNTVPMLPPISHTLNTVPMLTSLVTP